MTTFARPSKMHCKFRFCCHPSLQKILGLGFLGLLGCQSSITPNADTSIPPSRQEVSLELRTLLGALQIEIPVYNDIDAEPVFTEEDGNIIVEVLSNSEYTIIAQDENTWPHRYTGIVAEQDFGLIGYMTTKDDWINTLAVFQISPALERGTLFVEILDGAYHPMVGATASVNVAYDMAFTLNQTSYPWESHSILENGHPIIFFANVALGDVTITVQADGHECHPFPAGTSSEFQTGIYGNTITSVRYQCLPE